jgi:hypothetical protein
MKSLRVMKVICKMRNMMNKDSNMTVNYDDVIRAYSKAPPPTWVTRSAAASEGKKIGEGTIIWSPEAKPNPLVVADPPEAQALTPATTEQPLPILTSPEVELSLIRPSSAITTTRVLLCDETINRPSNSWRGLRIDFIKIGEPPTVIRYSSEIGSHLRVTLSNHRIS